MSSFFPSMDAGQPCIQNSWLAPPRPSTTMLFPMDEINLNDDDTSSKASSSSSSTRSSSSSSSSRSSKRRSVRGRPSYLFSVSKRPRRNVKKRPISSLPVQLETIGEEKETLLGIPVKRRNSDGNVVHDPNRAPKMALALFLLVCSAGGYRSFNDYRTSRKNNLTSSMVEKNDGNGGESDSEDVLYSFRGSSKREHREAMLDASSITSGREELVGEAIGLEMASEEVEDMPNLLFDEVVQIPYELSSLADVFHDHFNPSKNKLFFWHVPRTGSTTIKRIASHCMGLTIASEIGKSEVSKDLVGSVEDTLKIVEGLDGMRFANVDMSSSEGIARAKVLRVGQSSRIDLISSPYLYIAATVFDEDHKGFMVAMFRHPIERAVSHYYSMKKNPLYEKTIGQLPTVDLYARSTYVENNWMTRFLSNTLSGQLTPEHEAIAKEVLRNKCIIGLLREKTETMRRLQVLLDWKADRSQRRMECQEKLLYWDWPGKNRHDPVLEGSDAWNRLYVQNTFDIRLYEYAEKLFDAQGKLFEDVSSEW